MTKLADGVLPEPLVKATCCHRHAAMFPWEGAAITLPQAHEIGVANA